MPLYYHTSSECFSICDSEWISILTSKDQSTQYAREWFFKVKCYSIIIYINNTIMHEPNPKNLYGLFYECVSLKDWYVIRQYQGRNKASLKTWIHICAKNYFLALKKKISSYEKRRIGLKESVDRFISSNEREVILECAVIEQSSDSADVKIIENEQKSDIFSAFSKLSERDQEVLRLLVVEDCPTLEAAPVLFKYRKGGLPLPEMTDKQIQDALAIMKMRACARLLIEYNKTQLS